MNGPEAAWDASLGTAGGSAFGSAVQALSAERGVDDVSLAEALGISQQAVQEIFAGSQRVGVDPPPRGDEI